MRLIVTGVQDGRSCVVRQVDLAGGGGAFATTPMVGYALAELPPREPGRSVYADLQVPPGRMSWLRVCFAPGEEHPFHQTDTIDCHTIVEGSMALLLDDGAHELNVGDCAVVSGVDHGWRVGPEGCTSSLMLFGTPKPSGA
jgi:quercetin dioxygenase-like cupin family protein